MGRPSDAKDRLIEAAVALIWEDSYGSVTIDDICKRADVRKGSFYYFFPGKAELAVTAIEHKWESEWKPFLDRNLSVDLPPAERFDRYFKALVAEQTQLCSEHGKVLGCPLNSVGSEVCNCQSQVSNAIRDVFIRKRRYYESAIRDAVAKGAIEACDPEQKAVALFSLIDGVFTQARIMNDANVFNSLPDMARDLLRFKEPAAS